MPEHLLQMVNNSLNRTVKGLGQTAEKAAEAGGGILSKAGDVAAKVLPKKPPAPPVLPPTRMPTSSDMQAARRQSIMEQLRRRGRASTILTDNTDTLGA
jgi:hypothetical protein